MPQPRRRFANFVLISGVVALALSTHSAAQPVNDACADAIDVVEGEYEGTSLFSTGEGLSFCGSSAFQPDVWYRFVAPYNGQLSAHLCNGATYDTVIGIWNGCPSDGGSEIACNDDSCGMQRSSVVAPITLSEQYYIRVSGFEGDQGNFTLTVLPTDFGAVTGPDVVLSDVTEIDAFGPDGGVRAYISDTHTCNVGDTNLQWGGTTPLITWNAYRLFNGRFEQIGMSWVKNGTFAQAGPGCGVVCSGAGGSVLGAGCRDIYSAAFNADQAILGPRSAVNAFTGAYPGPSGACDAAPSICKRLQIAESDLDASLYPEALYFLEVVMVAGDDASAGNALNNVSYKRVAVDENLAMTPASPIDVGHPALEAWRAHGFGLNFPDTAIMLGSVDVPLEGRFHYAYHVRELGGGQWHYEYAVFNLNSHQSMGSFQVPIGPGVGVSNVGFRDVPYHSGEPLDGTDWVVSVDASGVTWSCPQTFGENPNANALRYGTMYNFWFDASAGPFDGAARLGLFRPGIVTEVFATMSTPTAPPPCLPGDINLDQVLDARDIQPFVDCALFGGTPGGDCACADFDASGGIDATDQSIFVFALLGF